MLSLQVPEYTDFIQGKRLAGYAIVPLSKGDVLDSKLLHHSNMTPPQAALQWNISSHVAVVPGPGGPCTLGESTLFEKRLSVRATTSRSIGRVVIL